MQSKGYSKLMEKKKKDGKDLSSTEKEAKMSVVQHMKDMAQEMMGDHLKGMKKVTVASDSDEGLKHGLSKASDIIEQGHLGPEDFAAKHPEELDDSDEEASESPEEEAKEQADGSYDNEKEQHSLLSSKDKYPGEEHEPAEDEDADLERRYMEMKARKEKLRQQRQ